MTEPPRDPLWPYLRTIREAAGLTQSQLAQTLEVDRTYISAVELGRRGITLDRLERWLHACDYHAELHPSAVGVGFTYTPPADGDLVVGAVDPVARARALAADLVRVAPDLPDALLDELEDRIASWRRRYGSVSRKP